MIQDYNGKEFKDYKSMCEYHKISYNTFKSRYDRGWTLEESLSSNCDRHNIRHTKTLVEERTDFKGNVFKSISDMCRFYNVPYNTYYMRRQSGLSIEEALTYKKPDKVVKEREVVYVYDNLGNRFDTNEDMCNFHGVKLQTFYNRVRLGYSLEDCLYKGNLGIRDRHAKSEEHKKIEESERLEKSKVPNKHIGEIVRQKNGFDCKLIEFRNYRSKDGVTVRFLNDGAERVACYASFKRGSIGHPNIKLSGKNNKSYRVGEKSVMSCGLGAEIIKYSGATDIDVRLSDGIILNSVSYKQFKEKSLSPRTPLYVRRPVKVGDSVVQESGLSAKLLEKLDSDKCRVLLENGNEITVNFDTFRKGRMKSTEQFSESRSVEDIIGKSIMQHCGLVATVVRARKVKDIDIAFEDDVEVHNIMFSTLENQQVCHPDIRPGVKNQEYRGYILKYEISKLSTGETYYVCSKVGSNEEDILSLQEIIQESTKDNQTG